MNKIGIDLGGTKIEGIILDEQFQVISRKRIPTPKDNYEKIVSAIVGLVNELQNNSNASIGVCTPGAISKTNGTIKNSNTQCLIGRSLKEDLEGKLGKTISVENDANCFALAEAQLGSVQGYGVVFGVIMGTGVGGGIIIDGKVLQGRTNIAGEWGHHTLYHGGNKCYCGRLGCVETYLSGPALENRWESLTGRKESVPEILKNSGTTFELWKSEFLENFGKGLSNVIDILDPDAIVLGGGLSNIDFLYNEGRDAVYANVFTDSIDTPILKNKLGDSAGVFGACLL